MTLLKHIPAQKDNAQGFTESDWKLKRESDTIRISKEAIK